MKKIVITITILAGLTSGVYAGSALNSLKSGVSDSVAEADIVVIPQAAQKADMLWDADNAAHRTVWITLLTLNFPSPQDSFDNAGGLVVDDGQGTMSGHILAAQMIDQMFVDLRGAKRAGDMNQVEVIARALGKKMILRDFANLLDTMYIFWGDNTK